MGGTRNGPQHVAGKEKDLFRDYDGAKDAKQYDNVLRHYRSMRENQCVAFVRGMHEKWGRLDKAEMTIWEAFEKLADFVDTSDPDTTSPNLEHMFQTAEGLRQAGEPDWMQLTGLIHDLGKVLYLWGDAKDGQDARSTESVQWGIGGDTWVVGCPIPPSAIFPEFNKLNPDAGHEVYDQGEERPCGMYEPKCGMDNLLYAFGHDEYMYTVLKENCPDFPEMGKKIVRLHSCYPWHEGAAYRELMAPGDEETERWVRRFNEFDLYTKSDSPPDVEALKPYYAALIEKYCPGKLRW
uniref:Inositol oxygenase n=1 Tax=Chromera velia CCMP2878 TaxID=1169474 RepID=A0A0G4HGA4_9ALVE|eukprot:Cvel_6704.t1-p1 / transcript=Cvel_6704.t1 / gene=Cvel_6704 / organism=Chromera_velia_CCMP2878 / gene_product=Probable inositol oxygenase, putative / transcript_product=Probable inositol oxygenase, putative / location=Cvel_scaffold334:78168-79883(+) / protein_length=293 / sequence_SO=supercontig / SO=protein_coding / is_pseudo=false